MAATSTSGTAASANRGPTRGVRQAVLDMVRSLGLVMIFVALVFFIGRPSGSNEQRVRIADYGDAVRSARTVAAYQVIAPEGLPAGWRATSARVIPAGARGSAGLHIGFVTPTERYAALEESDGPSEDVILRVLGRPAELNGVSIGGQTWRQFRAEDGGVSLVRTYGPATVIVTGTARLDEASTLAGSLR